MTDYGKPKLGNTPALVALMEKVARADDGTDDGRPGKTYGEGLINLARDMGIAEDSIIGAIMSSGAKCSVCGQTLTAQEERKLALDIDFVEHFAPIQRQHYIRVEPREEQS